MSLASGIVTGQKTLGSTNAEKLTTTSVVVEGLAVVRVSAAGTIYIGDSTVSSSTGFGLSASFPGVSFDSMDPSLIYVRGAVNDVVHWIGAKVGQ